jgi:hypothetical protein
MHARFLPIIGLTRLICGTLRRVPACGTRHKPIPGGSVASSLKLTVPQVRSHLGTVHMSRYRPVGSSARRPTGHSSPAYGARGPTPQSGHRAITLRAAGDFPPGRHSRSLTYTRYACVAPAPPDRKITGGVTHGQYQDGFSTPGPTLTTRVARHKKNPGPKSGVLKDASHKAIEVWGLPVQRSDASGTVNLPA